MKAKIIDEPSLRELIYVFDDRSQAGKLLSEKLKEYPHREDVLCLAIPAGGVPIGIEIAKRLSISLDIMIVRKIQIPWNTEAGFGALSYDGEVILNKPLMNSLALSEKAIEASISKTKKDIKERIRKFRENKPMPELKSHTVILVDDGLASGFTMLVAIKSVRKNHPKKIIVAIPTASLGALDLVSNAADEIVCLNIRSGPIFAVAEAYKNWFDLSEEEVIEILKNASD